MRLRAEKVDGGQGFLFARPLDVEAVNSLLNADARNRQELAIRGGSS